MTIGICLINKYNHSSKLFIFSGPPSVRYRKANGLSDYLFWAGFYKDEDAGKEPKHNVLCVIPDCHWQ